MEAQLLRAEQAAPVYEVYVEDAEGEESHQNGTAEEHDSGASSAISPVDELDEGDDGSDADEKAPSTSSGKSGGSGATKRVRDLPCNKCGRLYSSENSLRNHIRIKHSTQAPSRLRAQSSDGLIPIRAKSAPPPQAQVHAVANMLATAPPPHTLGMPMQGPPGMPPDGSGVGGAPHLGAPPPPPGPLGATHSNPELAMMQQQMSAYAAAAAAAAAAGGPPPPPPGAFGPVPVPPHMVPIPPQVSWLGVC